MISLSCRINAVGSAIAWLSPPYAAFKKLAPIIKPIALIYRIDSHFYLADGFVYRREVGAYAGNDAVNPTSEYDVNRYKYPDDFPKYDTTHLCLNIGFHCRNIATR